MAKWHRREQKRWKTRRERQRREKQPFYSLTITKDGTSAVSPITDHASTRRYFAAHDHVPEGIEHWSDKQIRAVAAGVVHDEPASWERALILLAHHRSQLACDLIKALWDEAPQDLDGFCKQAYAEGLMWIGKSYAADEEGEVIFEGGGGLPN